MPRHAKQRLILPILALVFTFTLPVHECRAGGFMMNCRTLLMRVTGSLRAPLRARRWPHLDANPLPYAGLVTSQPREMTPTPLRVELAPGVDALPADLRGRLLANGPGHFEAGDSRASILLGPLSAMIAAVEFGGNEGPVGSLTHIRNRRFEEERRSNQMMRPTWTTLTPDRERNIGLFPPTTSSVTLVPSGDKLLALDDMQQATVLDPRTFEVLPGAGPDSGRLLAHTRRDPRNGDLHLMGLEPVPTFRAFVTVVGADGRTKEQKDFRMPRGVYFHDWAMTEEHYVFLLHPYFFSPSAILDVIRGKKVVAEMFRFDPAKKNLVYVVSKRTGEARTYEADARFTWHILNAFEKDGKLSLVFSGTDANYDILAADSPFRTIMDADRPMPPYSGPTHSPVIRYDMDLRARGQGSLRETVVAARGNYDFPGMNPDYVGLPHRFAYYIMSQASDSPGFTGRGYDILPNELVKLDLGGGPRASYRFGEDEFIGEPIFAPAAGADPSNPADEDRGYVLTYVYSARTKTMALAIFDGRRIEDGPLAKVHFDRPFPIRFHGVWLPGR